ncbi:DUF6134 family protein [Olleya sp. HaHaR_3_96]|uniref:DUF6134 family protein n=1 Tax=Olleya sp. HaHaR_3_96 TaxID=2745560 RepID=UPI001C7714A3|nr:DUF6134 family protein [Olleya sp. HaHaR_3_96]QXP61330.1 hypothetical protein H0I26_06765 [Olleya sp. HaHaR_3_96]
MIKNLVVIIFFITLGSDSHTFEEKIIFDVIRNEKVIGNLKATKTIKDSKTYYKSSTSIKARIIKEIRVNYKYNVTFDSESLQQSNVNITVNEKSHAKTSTEWDNNTYQVVKNGKDEATITNAISYSTVQLYFEEPKNITTCYSEQNGSFNTIIAMGNHVYKKVNASNNENLYYYKNGLLTKATIDGGLIQFEIIRKSNH